MWFAALSVVVLGDYDAVNSSLRTHDASGIATNATLPIPGKGDGIFAVERKLHFGTRGPAAFVEVGSQGGIKPLEVYSTRIGHLKDRIQRESLLADALRLSLTNDENLVAKLGMEIDTSEATIYHQVTRQYNNAADILNRASIVDASLAENGNTLGAKLNTQMVDSEARETEMVGSEHELNTDYVNAMNIWEEMKADSNHLTSGLELQGDWMTKADTVIQAQHLAIIQLEGWVSHLEGQMMQVRGAIGYLAEWLNIPEEQRSDWDFLRDDESLEIVNNLPVYVTPNDPDLTTAAPETAAPETTTTS
jgi:hypothetical protein